MRKHSLRAFLALCLAAILLAVCLVGCGGSKENTTPTAPSSDGGTTTTVSTAPSDGTEPTTAPTDPATDATTAADIVGTDPTKKPSTTVPTTPTTAPTASDASVIIELPKGKTFRADQSHIFGVGYVEDQMNNRVSVDQAVYLLRSIGCRSARIWATCYSDSRTLVNWHVEMLHSLAQKLKAANIQVIFVTYWFESPERAGLSTFIPRRNLTQGSNYLKALQNFEDLTYMLIKEFPEVDCWELGNEWNHTGALNPTDYTGDEKGGEAFTLKEKADISCDLMYRSMKSAKRAGTKATMIMPAMAPADGMDGIAMTDYLEMVYQNIESGAFGSKDPRAFFDALAWHPYMWDSAPDMDWVKNNNRIYQIAIDHGDAGIPVFLTEFGYADNKNSRADATQAEWMKKAYELARRYLPYVESIHYYRMFTDTSRGNDFYGLFNQPEDGFGPKAKAEAFKKMAGGKGNLWQFYLPLEDLDD